jgi:transcriptional regulator with XRE-family HTH domain
MSDSSLRTIRKALGLTQVDLADILGLTQAAVSKMEKRTNQSLEVFIAMAKAKGYELSITFQPKDAVKDYLRFPLG